MMWHQKFIAQRPLRDLELGRLIDSEHARILYIEDERITAVSTKKILTEEGYQVTHVSSGEEALSLIDSGEHFDLILSDIDLGSGIDGPNTARAILEKQHIAVVFLTAHTEKETVSKVRSISNYGYIIKNSGEAVLLDSLQRALTLYAAEHKYAVAFELSPAAISINRLSDGQYLKTNQAFVDFLGYTKEEIQGRFFESQGFLVWTDDEQRHAYKKAIREHGEIKDMITTFRHKDGSLRYGSISSNLIIWNNELCLTSVVSDITEKVAADVALKYSEENHRLIFEHAPLGIFSVDTAGRLVTCNEQHADIIGTTASELIGVNMLELPDQQLVQATRDALNGHMSSYEGEYRSVGTGKVTPVRGRFAPITGTDNRVIGCVGIFEDFSARIEVERRLSESEEKYRTLVEKANEGIFIAQNNTLVFANRKISELINVPESELEGLSFLDFLHPDDKTTILDNYSRRIRGENVQSSYDFRIISRDGAVKWVLLAVAVIQWKGMPATLNLLTDITERKNAENNIKQLLAEKDLLLHEVHHRLKNNMAMLIGLLSLHADTLTPDDHKAIAALEDAQQRIRTMGILYDKLYRSEHINELYVKEYIPMLVKGIIQASSISTPPSVSFDTLDDIILPPEIVSTLGIILNELMTNTLKYSFPQDHALPEPPHISLTLKRIENEMIELVIADNGVGMPEGFDMAHSTGFGMTLVRLLTDQLAGTVSLTSGPGRGTRFTILFGL